MRDVLFVKTSSLGDVVHHLPALTEARAHCPDVRFGWVVEEAFAPLVRLHPAVADVFPVAIRRWRRTLSHGKTWREIEAFRHAVRARRYDAIIDSQGLLKSGLISRFAAGRHHGYDPNSITEVLACLCYAERHSVEWRQHAIARNRALTGLALGYTPEGPPDFGLDRIALAARAAAPYAVLLHGTAEPAKQWPEANWRMLAAVLGQRIDVVVPHGSDAEHERAMRIAEATARSKVLDRAPLDAMTRLIAGASLVVGLDTGLLHLAAALGVPAVAIFGASEPGLTGPLGSGPIEVLGENGAPPLVGDVAEATLRISPVGR